MTAPHDTHWVATAVEADRRKGETLGSGAPVCFNLNTSSIPSGVTELGIGGSTAAISVKNGQVCNYLGPDGWEVLYW